MENKTVTEFEAILEDVRNILYNNIQAQGMEIHISLERRCVPTIAYEVKGRLVKC